MRNKGKPLGAAAAVLMVALALAGQAWALYAGDGSKPDPSTGGWAITDYGQCFSGIQADGTIVIDTVHNDSYADCIDHVLNSGADAALYDTQAECIQSTARANLDDVSHYWTSNVCVNPVTGAGISMDGLDRTATNCTLKGGVRVNACTGAWNYDGPTHNGVGYEGGGFCYANMDMTTLYTTQAACNAAGINGLSWNAGTSQCRYSYGIQGYLSAAITTKDGASFAAGTFVNLGVAAYNTQGECLFAGFSWGTGVIKSGNSSWATTPNPSTAANIVDTRAGCLECHNSVSQRNSYAERWKEGYLKTGHKNMLRKVTAGEQLAGPDGVSYESTGWAQGPLDFGFAEATSTSGAWTYPLMYIFGDWMAPAPDGLDVVVWKGAAAGYNGGSAYSCTPCHSTGWSNPSAGICVVGAVAKPTSTTQAQCGTLGGTWYASNGVQGASYNPAEPGASFPAYANPDNSVPGITGRWDRDGILCSRCHQSVFSPTLPAPSGTSGHNVTPGTTANQQVTNICFGCHQSIGKVSDGTGTDTDLGNPALNITATATGFTSHPITNQFLNSPHAEYSAPATGNTIVPNALGKYDLVGNAASQYGSTFKGFLCRSSATVGGGSILLTYWDTVTSAVKEIKTQAECNIANGQAAGTTGYWQAENVGACTTCHNVHESLFDPAAEEPLKRECEICHVDETGVGGTGYAAVVPQISLATTNHPTVAGTPWDLSHVNACEVCHMPKAAGAGFPIHLWRISTDAAYSTFPDGVTKKNANVDADGKIWIDAGISCNQCHDGSVATAPVFDKAQAAAAAKGMHVGGSSAANTDCLACHGQVPLSDPAVPLLAEAPLIIPGTNHHGLHSTCQGCHANGHNGTLPDKTSNTYCLTCHTNSGPYAVHHAVAGLAVSGSPVTCQGCHTIPGVTVPPMTTRDQITAGCLSCHISAQGANAAIYPRVGTPDASQTQDNHHRGSSTLHFVTTTNNYGCKGCHGNGAPTATATGLTGATFCGECHTIDQVTEHHAGVCLDCHKADGSFSGTYGAGVTAGPDPELNTSCLVCHATAQGSAQAISSDLAAMKHGTGGGTPASFAKACATCHKAPAATPASFPGVAPVIDATCGQCHGGSSPVTTNGAPQYDTAYLTWWAAGMHSQGSTLPPVPGYTGLTTTNLAVSFTDNSTDSNGQAQNTLAIYVNWGDGQTSSGVGGAVFSHTYANGGIYGVIHKATDVGGRLKSEFISVAVTSSASSVVKRTLTVTVVDNQTAAAVSRAYVYLKKEKGSTGTYAQVKYGRTNALGQITFAKLVDGVNYKIVVYKSSLDFDGTKKGKQSQGKSDAFLVDADRTVLVEQGAAATNGPAAAPWRGTDGALTVFTVGP